jgi:hypothetical protein
MYAWLLRLKNTTILHLRALGEGQTTLHIGLLMSETIEADSYRQL